jgi:hypothetical protein
MSSTNGTKIYSSPLEKYWKSKIVNRHPPIGNEDRSLLWIQKMTQYQVKPRMPYQNPKT